MSAIRAAGARLSAHLDQVGAAAPHPPADVLAQPLTSATVAAYPAYYILGPGRAQAQATQCSHGYNLTDSCPCCP
ncbi:hypothetical protein ACFYY8_31455 [Streptosporangium sp. NPDC001559]|uniref:hypothetical protein n=1 Tax=Streptosporangium sp. NPDC001559 TaxID=3366187 RepID=UPI0036EF0DA7